MGGSPTCIAISVVFFVTMNPVSDEYAGRTELPETLKTLFRSVTMIRPDLTQISENLLLSQGFVRAGQLAAQLVEMKNTAKNYYQLRCTMIGVSEQSSLS